MAKSPSAQKRVRQQAVRTLRNKMYRSRIKTAERRLRAAVEQQDAAAVTGRLQWAYKVIDKAAKRGAIHANTAARRKARMARIARVATAGQEVS